MRICQKGPGNDSGEDVLRTLDFREAAEATPLLRQLYRITVIGSSKQAGEWPKGGLRRAPLLGLFVPKDAPDRAVS